MMSFESKRGEIPELSGAFRKGVTEKKQALDHLIRVTARTL
jgi:hypothetical protein